MSGLRLFLAGDVMLGRGIDHAMATSVDPELHEPHVRHAGEYVRLAEDAHGDIPTPIDGDWLWGDALPALLDLDPHARIVNLETAATAHGGWARGKGIHYRMHPENVSVLRRAGIDACILANNHVLDWGEEGLVETLAALSDAGIATAGAGRNRAEAAEPAVVHAEPGTIRVHAYALPSAGAPRSWAAEADRPGVRWLPEAGADAADEVLAEIGPREDPAEVVVASVHWGPNWGYDVPAAQRAFAHRLVDEDAVDVVFGHSSHHPKGVEIYRGKPIVYGAGDFVNDYEGIRGHASYRPELVVGWCPAFDRERNLLRLELLPFRLRNFRLNRPADEDVRWLADTLDRESRAWGTRVEVDAGGRLLATAADD